MRWTGPSISHGREGCGQELSRKVPACLSGDSVPAAGALRPLLDRDAPGSEEDGQQD